MTQTIFEQIKASDANVYKYYLNGEWKISTSGKTVNILNPTTNETAFNVQACTQTEVDAAFQGAKKAQQAWAKVPLWRRAEYIHKVAQVMRDNAREIAAILVKEVAKPAADAYTEVVRSADLLIYTADEAVRYLGEGKMQVADSFPGQERNKIALSSRVPLGVVLALAPFNYPLNLAVSKLGPALMAGNAVVLKTPTQGSVSGLMMAQCFHAAAGAMPGLIQVITGRGSEIGDYMTTHPLVNCISFTGGDTGLDIARKAGMVPLQMELGGKDAAVICEDADLDLAAKSIVKGAFSYSGQRCTAVKLVLVMESVADELITKVMAGVRKLTVGKPEDDANICAVISKSSANFIEGLVKDAEVKGATFLTKYQREDNLIWPCVLDHVTKDMRISIEEPFGPVLPFMRVKSIQEAVEHVNNNRLALQSCVFTRDVNQAMAISDALSTGTVQVNAAPARGPDHFPFQGFRDSGIGSQGVQGSLQLMTKVKSTVINMDKPSFTIG